MALRGDVVEFLMGGGSSSWQWFLIIPILLLMILKFGGWVVDRSVVDTTWPQTRQEEIWGCGSQEPSVGEWPDEEILFSGRDRSWSEPGMWRGRG